MPLIYGLLAIYQRLSMKKMEVTVWYCSLMERIINPSEQRTHLDGLDRCIKYPLLLQRNFLSLCRLELTLRDNVIGRLKRRTTTIGTAVAHNLWVGQVTIGNQTCQVSSSIGSTQEVTNRKRHDSRNGIIVEGERIHVGIRSNTNWNFSSKQVGMQLKKLHFGKGIHAPNVARQAIVVQVQLGQINEGVKFGREAACQGVVIQIQKDQIGQVSNLGRNGAGQSAMLHAPNSQFRQEAHFRWDGSVQVVFLCTRSQCPSVEQQWE